MNKIRNDCLEDVVKAARDDFDFVVSDLALVARFCSGREKRCFFVIFFR